MGLFLAVLLSQHSNVSAVDIIQDKVDKLNDYISPIKDEYIELYLKEARDGIRTLNLSTTTLGTSAYINSDFIIVAVPTDYDAEKNYFDCKAVDSVISDIIETTKDVHINPTIIIKSTVPVGYTTKSREKYKADNILFSPEFLRESQALYDNLYPSRIVSVI